MTRWMYVTGRRTSYSNFGVPAGDEGVGERDTELRQHLDPGLQIGILGVEPGRRRRQHRVVGPEAGDRRLLGAKAGHRVADLERLAVEV
jgi:hypothetical protein